MEQIDRLTTISKHLYDRRVVDQRKQIEELKQITPKNLYLCRFYVRRKKVKGGYHVTVIQASNYQEVIKKISEFKRIEKKLIEENKDRDGQNQLTKLEYVEALIYGEVINITLLDDVLIGKGYLIMDSIHHISLYKGNIKWDS